MNRASSNTVLLTCGRLPVGLELARAFHDAGWHVVVADPWPMHMCRMSRCVDETLELPSPQQDPDRFLDTLEQRCREYGVDLVLPVSEETPWVAGLGDRDIPVFTSSPADVLAVHDKLGFMQLAKEHGLDVPDTARADEAPASIINSRYVYKPRFSCSGRGMQYAYAGTTPVASEAHVVQQRIDGAAVNVFCVATDGETRLASAYRPRLEDGSASIAFERVGGNACVDWAKQFISAVNYTGLIAFDFIIDSSGKAWPIECNPRATSGIHFLAPDALVAAIVGSELPERLFRDRSTQAEMWSCFTRYLVTLGTPDATRAAWRVLTRFSDVSFQLRDPLPFLLMPLNSWRLLAKSLQRGHNFASAAVADIEWQPPKTRP